MTIINKLLNFFIFFLINIIILVDDLHANEQIKIILKINNSIITNEDIKNEFNYLTALNNDLKKIEKKEVFKIAKDSLIREKIKVDEIEKYINIENYDNNKNVDDIAKNIYLRLGIQNDQEFENYLQNFDMSLNEVKNKIKIEVLWNQLIAEKFKNQINVDIGKIKARIEDEEISFQNLIEYDLSEIVFSAKNKIELDKKTEEIKKTINSVSFKTAANKFSISDTANFGGNIGKVNENQLSKKIKKELDKINEGDFTDPIVVGNGYLIIKINKKDIINLKLDEKELIEKMVDLEKSKQYENFSSIYYNKIKLNSQINEL